jgi:sugar phosphate permease
MVLRRGRNSAQLEETRREDRARERGDEEDVMADAVEARTLTRVAWRFIPLLVLCNFVAYLDRVNVGFAKLTMDADLGFSDTAFGFGAGVFFFAYFLFEAPSNIILDKVGARRWIDPHLERAPEAAE